MQTIRGTKDILPNEIAAWQDLYFKALNLLTAYNYSEIRTPIIEHTEVFLRSVGNTSDIINKEMYRFEDQGKRDISLRPEGTASIARAVVSNKLYNLNSIQKLWYMGPMFRYERPQQGRQRQFHQLGVECIGSDNPIADVEVINIACMFFNKFNYQNYSLEINSLGTLEERNNYQIAFKDFLQNYKDDLDDDSKKRLQSNPLRILDSKNPNIQELIQGAPCISQYLKKESRLYFHTILETLTKLNIPFKINTKLVRGLDYYSHTTFEFVNNDKKNKKTICGGGRYSNLIKQFGGPEISGIGWAIGIERLLTLTNQIDINKLNHLRFEIITNGLNGQQKSCQLSQLLAENNILFNLSLSNQNLNRQIKKAIQNQFTGCLILGDNEINNSTITIKWLDRHYQETIPFNQIINYLKEEIKSIQIH